MELSGRMGRGGKTKGPGASQGDAAALVKQYSSVPKLVVFDLDDTLWHPEMYMLDGSPFKKDSNTGAVKDRSGEEIHFFSGVNSVFSIIENDPQFADTEIAVASKTTEPKWARTCMRMMDIHLSSLDGEGSVQKKSLESLVDHEEIYPRNKKAHFQQLKKATGLEYEDMLFFDNERWNIVDISKLGVVCSYCPRGLSESVWLEGMRAFEASKK